MRRWLTRAKIAIVRPFMVDRELSYYDRPHCRWPYPRKGTWADHALCGEPPDGGIVDVQGVANILARIKSGDHDHLGTLLPSFLRVFADEADGLPVCKAHHAVLMEEIGEVILTARDDDVEALKAWLSDPRAPKR